MSLRRDFPIFLAVVIAGAIFAGVMAEHLGVRPTVGRPVAGGIAAVLYLLYEWRRDRTRPAIATATARRTGKPYESPWEVRFDDAEIVVTRNGKPFERVAWDDIIVVGVNIDDAFLPQPWWLLFSPGGKGVHYPSEARGSREMLHELQRRLPGFDSAAVIRAMGMMEGGEVLWKR